jgi:signal transduction histidine kinase/CheY-like chemotaxis protein
MRETIINQTLFPPPGGRDADIRHNMDDLRRQLISRLAVLALLLAQFTILFYNPPVRFPVDILLFWLSLTGLSLLALKLNDGRSPFTRHLLTWGLLLELLLAMYLFPFAWLPFIGAALIFAGGMLVSGSEWVTAVAVWGTAVILNQNGLRDYALAGTFIVLALAAVITWLAARNLYTSLDWVWQMNERAEELLDATRNQQAELHTTVKSLQILNDIHARTERELLITHQQLRQSQQLKEQFAANISHELRTPLSIILGFSEVMYLSPEVYGELNWPPTLMRDVAQIYRNSRHLLGLIDDILDLSRFEMVGFTLHKEPTQLKPLLQETAAIVTGLFELSPDLMLKIELPPDLPMVELDQTRIRQVLLNLLNNARRYTTAGTVTLSAEHCDDEVIIHVSDTGPGIAPENLANIFTEFYQVDYSLSRQHGGAGLGLAICQRFVEAHDGRIWATSEPGIGSTFSFSLPLPDHKPTLKSYRTRPLEPLPQLERPYLLVIDSDPLVISLIQRHLDDFEVLPVADMAELAELITTYRPIAAIGNVRPGQTLPAAWKNGAAIPLIECSLPSQAWLADTLGAIACLTKPIRFEQLRQEMARLGTVQTVLVVDDNPGVCQLVERGLRTIQEGLAVQIAYDGRAALHLMQQEPPDLVILDLMMPQLDGLEVRAAMQADTQLAALPVILLTATNYIEDTLAQYGSQLRLIQPTPWHPGETLRCLDAILKSLKPTFVDFSHSQYP